MEIHIISQSSSQRITEIEAKSTQPSKLNCFGCWEESLWEVISLENKKQNLRKSVSIGVPVSVILCSGQGCKLGVWKLSNGCEGLGNPTCHKYMSHSTSWFPHQCVWQLLLFRRKKGKVTRQLPFILMQNSPNRLSSSASMVHMFCVGKGNSEVRQTLFRLFFFLRSVCKDRFCEANERYFPIKSISEPSFLFS